MTIEIIQSLHWWGLYVVFNRVVQLNGSRRAAISRYGDVVHISDRGVEVDRTGTGTISVTGMLLRYDLRDGTIPLITTKKVNIDPLRQELEWFIEGTGSVKRLNERGVKIWDNWATDDGHLNFVYGYQWRFWPAVFSDGYQYVKDQIAYQPRFYSIPVHAVQLHQQPGYFTLSDPEINDEWYLWRNIIANQGEYELCSEWKLFENFAHDIRYLPGYLHWKKLPNDLILSPLWSGAHIASRDTCAFISLDEYISIRDGESNNALPAKDGYVVRRKLFHDQLQNVVDQIKTNPYSRRIKVNAWNVDLLDQMQLPPCHYDFTFVNQVLDSGEIETSLQLNMRSNDYCLGNPFKKYKVEMIGCDMFVIHDEDDTAIVNLMTLKKLSKKEINLSEICWN